MIRGDRKLDGKAFLLDCEVPEKLTFRVDQETGRPSTDLFATVLHQLGMDYNTLTYDHHGRDETLTDSPVSNARVVRELLDV